MLKTMRIAEVSVKYVKKEVPCELRIFDKQKSVISAEAIVNIFRDMENELQEKFLTVYLNGKNNILCYAVNFIGTLNYCNVSPKEVIRVALLVGSPALIILHNHPSGVPEPSESDIEITQKIKEASNLMDIKMLDSIIIGENRYYSFSDRGLIKGEK